MHPPHTPTHSLSLTLCSIDSDQLPPLGSTAHCSTAPSTANKTSHCRTLTRLAKRGQRGGGGGGGRAAQHTETDTQCSIDVTCWWLIIHILHYWTWWCHNGSVTSSGVFTCVLSILSPQFPLSLLSLEHTSHMVTTATHKSMTHRSIQWSVVYLGLISSAVVMKVKVELFVPLRTKFIQTTTCYTWFPVEGSTDTHSQYRHTIHTQSVQTHCQCRH